MICVRHNLDLGSALKCQQCESEVAEQAKAQENVRDYILAERDKGNLVVMGIEGLMSMPLEKFVEQPAEGILYDLNRLEEVCLSFIADRKWVNDFAVALTIRKLVEERDQLKHDMERGMANHNADLNNGQYVSQSKALEQALELLTACSQCDIQYDAKDWMRRELAAEYGVDVDDRDSSVADVVDAFLKLHPISNPEGT